MSLRTTFRALSPDGSTIRRRNGLRARTSLAAGKAIVEDTGYHRRDGAVKQFEDQLG